MGNTLYLDGSCGIAGDMFVAALLNLGVEPRILTQVLDSLPIRDFHYHITQKSSYSLAGCDFHVALHHHEHAHEEAYREHRHHEHRHLSDVYAIIDQATMTPAARTLAKRIFLIVAEAEAQAHGVPVETVHFHEVGAVDSIVDIIAAAVLIDHWQIERCIVTGLTEGQGTVQCQHGQLPVPVPAVLNIAVKYGIALQQSASQGEMITPTGIAIAAAICTADTLPSLYRIERIGIGLGKKDFGRANCLRAMLITEKPAPEQIMVIESNIDDSTAEELALVQEKLFTAGALDVHFEPCFMKKCRPAYILRIICPAHLTECMERLLFTHTSTIGCRKFPVERTVMQRATVNVRLDCGTVQVKKCTWQDIVRYYPEYESVKALAEQTSLPFRTIFDQAKQKAALL